ncbi:MAG: hypothetical protein KZQ83_02955 [gamma proteobacterium symbiont of Taylorina sp.]|nr:hypothetical protein [gamma proteobacterium symbiont of Taylorina sp.]
MGFKSNLLKSNLLKRTVKVGAKLTPKILVVSVANILLKGVAEFSDILYDLDQHTAFVKVTLYGEEEAIEVALDGFEILGDEENYQFILHKAQSNKPWMNNILARIVGKTWDIPEIPQYKDELGFVANLLKAEEPEQETVKEIA